MLKFVAIMALGLTLYPGAAVSSPVTLACQFQAASAPDHPFAAVDQFVYDLESESADLRVARTMGTAEPVNWLFTTSKTALDDDRFVVKRTAQGIVGAGVYGSAPHSFDLYDNGLLVWSFIWFSAEPTWLVWQCEP